MRADVLKFKYARYSDTLVRPVIPVTVRHSRRTVAYELLIDSGADLNIFDAALAVDLGIDVEAGVEATVLGATGEVERVFVHPVTLTVGDHTYKTRAAFMLRVADSCYGLAGQRGIFDQFRVTFDLQAEEIELSRY